VYCDMALCCYSVVGRIPDYSSMRLGVVSHWENTNQLYSSSMASAIRPCSFEVYTRFLMLISMSVWVTREKPEVAESFRLPD